MTQLMVPYTDVDAESHTPANPEEAFISVIGKDRPGCIHCAGKGRSIFRTDLKLVCPSFKLLHQLIPVKTKLEVLSDDHHEEFFIRIYFYNDELFYCYTFHIFVCVVVVQAFLVLDPRVVYCSGCVFASDNVCVVCWSDQG
ncbi:hypothetical protein Taro_000569 [Colocasia esculenta]|uniref:Uncharacterized protein n=1 Tax=Colocasia esculenta TaxID=4460 RepID=A0A843TDM5_COLES|nr:hypothetical protein [Colocasia esculenta]